MTEIKPITRLPVGEVPERVLVVGDPARVALATTRLDDPRELASNREYVTWVGGYRGTTVGVMSHGVGSAGAAACFEELISAGATRLIRAGTAGGLQAEVADGDLVVATGAIRDDGITRGLVPPEFPAVADHRIVSVLLAAARTDADVSGPDTHAGVVLTSDVFYPHGVLGSNLELWQRAGAIAVEMECSALFVVSALHHIAAGAILTIDGNPLATGDSTMDGYDPDRQVVSAAVESMIDIALRALID